MNKRKPVDISSLESMAGDTVAPINRLEARKRGIATSRDGKVQMGVFVDPKTRTRIKQIALDADTSVSALLQEAIEYLLEKYTS